MVTMAKPSERDLGCESATELGCGTASGWLQSFGERLEGSAPTRRPRSQRESAVCIFLAKHRVRTSQEAVLVLRLQFDGDGFLEWPV